MKDNFSTQSDQYAKYRPVYPSELFDFLKSILPLTQLAWDCGTGNGQIASELANFFEKVYASDISQSQIDHAIKKSNIIYSIQKAESTNFENQCFDLIVVAQAIHWFQFEEFYKEVKRTAKNGAYLCVIGYGRLEINKEIDPIISNFYQHVIGPYWDDERKYIDQSYQTIPFPFPEIKTPNFSIECSWTLDELIGYLNTWSAVKHYIKKEGTNPVDNLHIALEKICTKDHPLSISFPLFIRMGKIEHL